MSTLRDRFEQVERTFNVSQSQLARRVGVSPQMVSQIVTGKYNLSYLLAKSIEAEFGVNSEWMLTGEGSMLAVADNKAKELNLVPELATALKNYPGITNALNQLAKKMTLPDWEALNAFICRSEPSSVADEEILVQSPESGS